MYYCPENNRLQIEHAEICHLCGLANSTTYQDDTKIPLSTQKEILGKEPLPILLKEDLSLGDYYLQCEIPVDDLEPSQMTFLEIRTFTECKLEKKDYKNLRIRALMALTLYKENHTQIPKIHYVFYNPITHAHFSIEETIPDVDLSLFRHKLAKALYPYYLLQKNKEEERLPTLQTLKFPYPTLRKGQRELLQTVRRYLYTGGTLFTEAPTGIGKTISVLYPALLSLGKKEIEKIFYFTPKSTITKAAVKALEDLHKAGGNFLSVIITAKERICPFNANCYGDDKPCSCFIVNQEKMAEAIEDLLSKKLLVVDEPILKRTAFQYHVCPYELSLRYAELADIVLCDTNYLLDLRVYFRRFFDKKHSYAFLFDEAHVIPDRYTESFSGEISSAFFDRVLQVFPEKSEPYCKIEDFKKEFCECLHLELKGARSFDTENGEMLFASSTQNNEKVLSLFSKVLSFLYSEKKKKSYPFAVRQSLRDDAFTLETLLIKHEDFSKKYRLFYSYYKKDDLYQYKLVCLDPSTTIRKKLECGKTAIFFSATLTPMEYYKTYLGDDKNAETLTIGTPFSKEQMAVGVIDQISTRLKDRQNNIPLFASSITNMISCKTGNYFVFCPSFSFMEELANFFQKLHNNIKVQKQSPTMTREERLAFLNGFQENPQSTMVAFAVSGGIFAEGIDLVGNRLIGAVVIGVGLPTLTPEKEAICEYFDEKSEKGKEYAYVYPGLNRVLQASGRVIRTPKDLGTILLIDDRFRDPLYRKILPETFPTIHLLPDTKSIIPYMKNFWNEHENY